jgi:hypothetical protein
MESESNNIAILLCQARDSLLDFLEIAGSCDHELGICYCSDYKLVKSINDMVRGHRLELDNGLLVCHQCTSGWYIFEHIQLTGWCIERCSDA